MARAVRERRVRGGQPPTDRDGVLDGGQALVPAAGLAIRRNCIERTVVTEYAELNWTNSMIVTVSILRISRYHGPAVETLK